LPCPFHEDPCACCWYRPCSDRELIAVAAPCETAWRERRRRIAGALEDAVIDHLSLQCQDTDASAAFYDRVLDPLGGGRVMEFGDVIAFGVAGQPTFWIGPLATGGPNREVHVAFRAPDRDAVRAFHDAAVAAGATVLHEPREWPEYHPGYYGAFVRDPDGNNVEAVCHST
jgi:catechol 2,3-dioxygenase-like lactoylglutathione lyase family enzyme